MTLPAKVQLYLGSESKDLEASMAKTGNNLSVEIRDRIRKSYEAETRLDNNGSLKLSAARQDWLAEVADKAANVYYKYRDGKQPTDAELIELGLWFASHAADNNYGLNNSHFSDLYDQLHRSGSNS